MATGKGRGTDKGAAARREADGDELAIEFRGLEITLPPKLPASVVWRYGTLRDNDVVGAARMIEAMIGKEQFALVLDKLDEDGLTTDDEEGMSEVGRIAQSVLSAYGMTEGEAEASQES